jgi:hypothetical protein
MNMKKKDSELAVVLGLFFPSVAAILSPLYIDYGKPRQPTPRYSALITHGYDRATSTGFEVRDYGPDRKADEIYLYRYGKENEESYCFLDETVKETFPDFSHETRQQVTGCQEVWLSSEEFCQLKRRVSIRNIDFELMRHEYVPHSRQSSPAPVCSPLLQPTP